MVRICKTDDGSYFLKRKRNRFFSTWGNLEVSGSGRLLFEDKYKVLLFLDEYDCFNTKDIVVNSNDLVESAYPRTGSKCEMKL
ncbi:MAG: hypothetical protein GY861_02480 [bacterium]|nr:hypothetical protein [bacterium]